MEAEPTGGSPTLKYRLERTVPPLFVGGWACPKGDVAVRGYTPVLRRGSGEGQGAGLVAPAPPLPPAVTPDSEGDGAPWP